MVKGNDSSLVRTLVEGEVSCANARQAARAVLADHNWSAAEIEDVMSVVTELVSNAQRHAGGATRVRIAVRTGTVTIEVSDPADRMPCLQPRAPDRPGGFGWRLVNDLADTVETRAEGTGKTVTATLTGPRVHA